MIKKEGNIRVKKDKKENFTSSFTVGNGIFFKSKTSQITLFVILAIIIVAVLIIFFTYALPKIKSYFSSPQDSLEKCLGDNVNKELPAILLAGGTLNPELYFMYEGGKVDYLCYTSEYYKTCTMQKPFIKQNIESQLKAAVGSNVQKCFNDYTEKLRLKGYIVNVSPENVDFSIQIMPEKIVTSINNQISAKKGEETISYSGTNLFNAKITSNVYEILMVASSILNFEARYGDSNPETYMFYYKNLKVEKKKQSDGTKVYIITDKNTDEKFKFATRSLAWPPGYALE
jgi:hypothetical protein